MGMAASQARILLLTSRKSDLELQAQFITQEKMLLSMQTEEIANEYTTAIANKTLKLNWFYDDSKSEMKQVDLTYSQLTSSNNTLLMPDYRITNAHGDIIVRNASDPVLQKILYKAVKADDVPANEMANYDEKTGLLKIADIVNGKVTGISATYASSDNGKSVIYAGEELDNKELFQSALRQGTIFIEQLEYTSQKEEVNGQEQTEYVSTGVWSKTTWQGSQNFSDEYYTEDDALAEAQYQSRMQRIQSKDKVLDNELKQIETLHKACETEIDSVKSVIDKNVEKSFKIFS